MLVLTGADRDLASRPRRLLSIHAHPDDEASKGSATVAYYAEQGVGAVLVCCTGGEAGDILNPAMDLPDVRANLAAIRQAELAKSAGIIGYERVWMLGYRDSGMPDTEANAHPDCFAQAEFAEAVERLVRIIRAERPHVIVTYPDDQRGYRHPDHLRVHDISGPAFALAADPHALPDAGAPWRPLKLYYSTWSMARIVATHQAMVSRGIASPYDDDWLSRPSHDHRITSRVWIGDHFDARPDSLLAHATQVDPTSPFWFGLPRDVARTVHPYDDYILARTHVPVDLPEDDLFSGVELA
ncbi:MAG: mycothiol conjugate amidase Mca [Acidimicrobiales bacterium]